MTREVRDIYREALEEIAAVRNPTGMHFGEIVARQKRIALAALEAAAAAFDDEDTESVAPSAPRETR